MPLTQKELAHIVRRLPRHSKAPVWDTEWWLGREVLFEEVIYGCVEAMTTRGVRMLTFEQKMDANVHAIITLVQANIWLAQGVLSLPH